MIYARLQRRCGERKQTPWSEFASELYQPSDRRLSTKLVPTFADSGCHVVSVTDPYGCILGFLDRTYGLYSRFSRPDVGGMIELSSVIKQQGKK
jgi:hypothetical protein